MSVTMELPMTRVLLDLPVELLMQIFRLVDCDELRRTLKVCKHWRDVARPLSFEDSLLRLDKVNAVTRGPHAHFFSNNLRTLSLHFGGTLDCIDMEPSKLHESRLEVLGSHLQSLRHLSSLKILQSEMLYDPGRPRMPPVRNIISESAWTNFATTLSNTRIEHLEVDIWQREACLPLINHEDDHLCAALARIIPRLQTLRLRLPYLCYTILDGAAVPNCKLRSLTISTHPGFPAFYQLSRYCERAEARRFATTVAGFSFAAQMEPVARRMAALEEFQVICYDRAQEEIYKIEVLSGEMVRIRTFGATSTGSRDPFPRGRPLPKRDYFTYYC